MTPEPSAASERYLKGQRVEIVGAPDYNGQRGIVAWTEPSDERLGVWLDSQNMAGTDMPITFLRSEVVRYGPCGETPSAAQGHEYEGTAWPPAAERAFARWCAEQVLIEDYAAPHGQAFLAGWLEGVNWKPSHV